MSQAFSQDMTFSRNVRMPDFANYVAVVTGASSGIGKAIAQALAAEGATVCLVGRSQIVLNGVAKNGQAEPSRYRFYRADLNLDDDIRRLVAEIQQEFGYLDILIHSAGVFSMGAIAAAPVDDLDRLYRVNVRAPYLLTKLMLPMITVRSGQVAFINSSAGLQAKMNLSQYSAAKHALKAIADSLRAEVNGLGIRVLSVYPGRTATPMQNIVHEMEGRAYNPEKLMQPADVADAVVHALSLSRSAEMTDIHIRPMKKFD